jgi:hypothetical protein
MKRILFLVGLATFAALLPSCTQPQPVVIHRDHYYTRPAKSASVSGSNSPEGFSAVTPPSSYSQ